MSGKRTVLAPQNLVGDFGFKWHCVDLSVLAQIRRVTRQARHRKFEGHRDRVAARVSTFGAVRNYTKHADIRIGRAFRPPRLRLTVPQDAGLRDIARHLSTAGHAQIRIRTGVGK